MNGILAVDKPYGWTSHDVVSRVRGLSRQRRIGHAGTLDPMATGVLLLCLGDATRVSDMLMDGGKWYLARITFGAATDTDDALGNVISRSQVSFALASLVEALRQQVGSLMQTPPTYAAIKNKGIPNYQRARAGQAVEVIPRSVTVHSICLLDFEQASLSSTQPGTGLAQATILVSCGKGTYIRSIARDVGMALDCGAHLSALRRLASGRFTTRECVKMEDLQVAVAERGPNALEPLLAEAGRAVEDWPAIVVDDQRRRDIVNGVQFVVESGLMGPRARLYGVRGELLGLAEVEQQPSGCAVVHPFKVFAGAVS
jgi:tRNA pseudouridine55 synthase